ncbi:MULTISPECIES: YraN family protein [unclassified Leptolyngbya]|uniref:YraN family protein n=1 Tax=unclassified Leptolyngbya TaxID=2650499 RepID=UPI00168753FC|nr:MULTISPECIES: YraN family protein [unclassified Leptolyngbya]MBD1911298.1 YraN family protein [Leptolyngbya sp. FACHB-8]MBD2156684.1 YraN family protein [Leptolyngbya sp. FACHB-16]
MASSGRSASSSTSTLGYRAEEHVGKWLAEAGWELLHHRWRCRWGELDWVALTPKPVNASNHKERDAVHPGRTQHQPLSQELVFIEVKARRQGNWDADGLLAITPQKQAKLWRAAELFLADDPHWATFPCRFDVVLVRVTGNAAERRGEQLVIQQHIPNAFSL